MQNIKAIFEKKHFTITDKKVNSVWEQAVEFWEYLGVKPNKGDIVFLLGLQKRYGSIKVLNLKSFLKDAAYDSSRLKGLMVWKLKQ